MQHFPVRRATSTRQRHPPALPALRRRRRWARGRDAWSSSRASPARPLPGASSASGLAADFDTYVLDVRGRGLSSSSSDTLDYSLDASAGGRRSPSPRRWALRDYAIGRPFDGRPHRHPRRAPVPRPGSTRLVLVDPPVSGPGRRAYPAQPAVVRRLDPPDAAHGTGVEAHARPSARPGPRRSCGCAPSGCTPATSARSLASLRGLPPRTTSTPTCRTSRCRPC